MVNKWLLSEQNPWDLIELTMVGNLLSVVDSQLILQMFPLPGLVDRGPWSLVRWRLLIGPRRVDRGRRSLIRLCLFINSQIADRGQQLLVIR